MNSKRSHIYRHKYYTFDIETTTIITGHDEDDKPILNGIIWSGQFYDGKDYVQVRSLKEVLKQINLIALESSDYPNDKICIFVQNLSYEFAFIKDFFKWDKILCTSERKIISAETDQLVFRCTYFLSNMGLEKFLKNENVPEEYQKTKMDYDKERYPWTPINADEYKYCANDVIGLHYAVKRRIEDSPNKDINNMPLTSTGYVRKDCRKAVGENYWNRARFLNEALCLDYFKMCHRAFRGGNTHSNRRFANKVLKMLGMQDIRSSYPASLLLFDYPTKFFEMLKFKQREFDFYLKNYKKWAMLIDVSFKEIKLKNPDATPVPYISISKCEKLMLHSTKDEEKALEVDNGRVLSAAYLETTITEIDYMIIKDQYEFEDEAITRVLVSKKKPIPKELKKQILKYFYDKTALKQEDDDPDFDPEIKYMYNQSKSRLNGIYGMHVTLPIRPEYLINNEDESIWVRYEGKEEDTEIPAHSVYQSPFDTEDELLAEFYSSFASFLSYQVGVWVTSYSRMLLDWGMKCCLRTKEDGSIVSDLVYVDTDSCKYLNPQLHEEAFKALNSKIEALAEKRGAFIDYEGKRWYLGIYEGEKPALRFKTFGAKKYMYEFMAYDKKTKREYKDFEITISGVPKKEGKECILKDIKRGKLKDPFDIGKGYVFHAVKMTSFYQDYDKLQEFTTDCGKKVYFGSNIAMQPSSYTLGLASEYELLLDTFKEVME